MTTRRYFIGLAIVCIFVLGFALQATAETLNFKMLTHGTKAEMVPIADVEGHVIGVSVREGVTVFENGDWVWTKGSFMHDMIKGAGATDAYFTFTFLDGSTFIARAKGTAEATPQGVISAYKWTSDIINGTGRFQGIKGTITFSSKFLPPEKGGRWGRRLPKEP
jgi:hypothetical protein